MLQNLIIQFSKFPGAESIHLLQGVVAGFLLANGYIRDSVARVCIALTLLAGFAIYEGYEMFRIKDEGDIDFQVFLITMWLSCCVTLAIHLYREWRHGDEETQ